MKYLKDCEEINEKFLNLQDNIISINNELSNCIDDSNGSDSATICELEDMLEEAFNKMQNFIDKTIDCTVVKDGQDLYDLVQSCDDDYNIMYIEFGPEESFYNYVIENFEVGRHVLEPDKYKYYLNSEPAKLY
jgi:hypothetical protein